METSIKIDNSQVSLVNTGTIGPSRPCYQVWLMSEVANKPSFAPGQWHKSGEYDDLLDAVWAVGFHVSEGWSRWRIEGGRALCEP